ncbi:MAG: class I SAM-dependent methyltransferase [Roseibium sp.]|uniref:class I SAM-dependent methyltransferase n=1 Tax=Roseibium sp. TaxID=1936156 RepID=UPI00262594FD|nr:class I SAM-dependent methyltransferase [Roseibium sp.]MCV0426244.1 class I SAM-dependent methyltransferase [Roseibium sp.]
MADYDKNPSPYLKQAVSENPYRLLEWTVFMDVLGPVSGKRVLDLACGDGRLTRILAHGGAVEVLGLDISVEMLERANAQNAAGEPEAFPDMVTYGKVSAADDMFEWAEHADIVTAMYLFHYAQSLEELGLMGRFIGRNLKDDGRFVTYAINPDYDFTNAPDDMEERIGFRYGIVDPPAYTLIIKDFEVPIWQWSRQEHEDALKEGGLTNIEWHALKFPPDQEKLNEEWAWYLDNPSCVVLSAEKPG